MLHLVSEFKEMVQHECIAFNLLLRNRNSMSENILLRKNCAFVCVSEEEYFLKNHIYFSKNNNFMFFMFQNVANLYILFNIYYKYKTMHMNSQRSILFFRKIYVYKFSIFYQHSL